MCLWHSRLKKCLHCSYKVSLSSYGNKDMYLTSSNDLYMRHPHSCIPSQAYIYPMLATHNNIVLFDWNWLNIYLYINFCSIGKYTPSFEVSATKPWTDMKYTSEGENGLGKFTRRKHIWALHKKNIRSQNATHDWVGLLLPILQLFNNFSQTILNLVKRTKKCHVQHKAYFHTTDVAGVICS